MALLLCLALPWYDNLTDVRRASTTLAPVLGVTVAGLVAVSCAAGARRSWDNVRSIAEAAQPAPGCHR